MFNITLHLRYGTYVFKIVLARNVLKCILWPLQMVFNGDQYLMSHAWFYVATSGLEWDGRCWHQKAGIFHLILSQKLRMLGQYCILFPNNTNPKYLHISTLPCSRRGLIYAHHQRQILSPNSLDQNPGFIHERSRNTHTCRLVDGTSMNEECVAVDAVGSMSISSNSGLTTKSAP